ncbi:hypothetical protein SPBR_09223 [Sporothrix brasiliensis 5110]|uniref:DOMON domain-containing protein n=1 Tax=Sporothrix brasiliensis 5110 TaxID=1398154 RepID=A0A0C2J4T9_9PEZI|nr:uncharacterized protein SPBR_09223 [Sporothrix brasiliensis 5110]KIH94040.1 hypothetical protein SPBR_09223 [Sporothrix brasiliensis 5110]
MKLRFWGVAACVAALLCDASAAGTTAYHDPQTGLTFAEYAMQYKIGHTLVFRVAVPTQVTSLTAYDAVLQVVAPIDAGWIGFAWGGRMIGDPLAVAWSSGNAVVLSSRRASDHTAVPGVWTGAQYTELKAGTHVNGTHWQYTAKCTGCTYYTNSMGSKSWVYATGTNHLAFAYSATRPANPSSAGSSLTIHDVTNNWEHDFSVGQNADFADLVTKNS